MATHEIVTDPNLLTVLDASHDARDQALKLVDQIAALNASLEGAAPEAQQEISKQQKLLITNLAQLRGLHRAAHFGARQTKSQTSEARQEVDRLHLQLQNLYYEQRHLQGEIAACESYDHTYQHLPLVPLEEFLAAKPECADADENTLMIARIEHERSEREALEAKRMELLKRKQKLIADNKKRKDDLANLDKELEKFIDAAKPIQKLFEKNV
ncbi:Fms-interacting protein-domain-containing protein [Hypoxylon fuscum]|nr:Fms-interacting protein-domain-containing protein [Hypoxylon fuscum]